MMETKRKIVVVGLGEVLFDCDVERGDSRFGGAPANFADHFLKCARLIFGEDAVEVYVVSAIGAGNCGESGRADEFGARVERELKERGLKSILEYIPGHPTGIVKKRRNAAGSNTYDILSAAWDGIPWTDALEALALETDVVCFGTLVQREEDPGACKSRTTIRRFLDEMIRSGRDTLRVFDVNLRQDFHSPEVIRESFECCNVLKVSDEEVPTLSEALCGYRIEGDAGEFCRALLERHDRLKLVILTEGGRGSRIFTPGRVSGYVIREKERIKPVDTVGAGDSFTAAFCAMYKAGRDLWEAQKFASKVSAFVCSDESATPAYPEGACKGFFEGPFPV